MMLWISAPFIDIPTLIANPGSDSKISLREAIRAANINAGPDTIDFDPSVFNTGTPQTILLTEGELDITESVTITTAVGGTGDLQAVTIEAFDSDGIKNGLNGSRIFDIDMNAANSTTTLIGLKLTGGDSNGNGGAIDFRDGDLLKIEETIFEDNHAGSSGSGGAIRVSSGALDVSANSYFQGNTAEFEGGAISIRGSNTTTVKILDTNFIDNDAGSNGGGISMYYDSRNANGTAQEMSVLVHRELEFPE